MCGDLQCPFAKTFRGCRCEDVYCEAPRRSHCLSQSNVFEPRGLRRPQSSLVWHRTRHRGCACQKVPFRRRPCRFVFSISPAPVEDQVITESPRLSPLPSLGRVLKVSNVYGHFARGAASRDRVVKPEQLAERISAAFFVKCSSCSLLLRSSSVQCGTMDRVVDPGLSSPARGTGLTYPHRCIKC